MNAKLLKTLQALGIVALCLVPFQGISQVQSDNPKGLNEFSSGHREAVKNPFSSITTSIDKEVRGTVRDSSGILPGASVIVKNRTSIGTTTDMNGKFIL